jgi:acyl-CoA thioester hydrolase
MTSHKYQIEVRWGEMDALGHVNNAVYLQYFEAARVEWFSTLGHVTGNQTSGPVVLQSNCTYRAPVVFPCRLNVLTQLISVGNTSFALSQSLVGSEDGKDYTEAMITCVWVDRKTGKPVAVPELIRRILND